MGGFAASEIPLLSSILYLFGEKRIELRLFFLCLKQSHLVALRLSPKTVSGGEFDWGGTSVKS